MGTDHHQQAVVALFQAKTAVELTLGTEQDSPNYDVALRPIDYALNPAFPEPIELDNDAARKQSASSLVNQRFDARESSTAAGYPGAPTLRLPGATVLGGGRLYRGVTCCRRRSFWARPSSLW